MQTRLIEGGDLALVPHPECGGAPYRIEAAALFAPDGRWRIDWRVTGDAASIVLPAAQRGERRDGLWERSCFELFVMRADGSYCEWNFSPGGDWALYEFSAYRRPVSPPPATLPPVVATRAGGAIECAVLADVAPVMGRGGLRVGLSAVIERADGSRDYWALAHPEGRPDFHAEACFAACVADAAPPRR